VSRETTLRRWVTDGLWPPTQPPGDGFLGRRKIVNRDRAGPPAMAGISSLRANANATIEAEITAISEPRDVTTSRGPSKVADATLKDETGTITLTLWGDDIKKYNVGQKVKITDGWVKDFRGKLQVSMGRSGTITVQ
jgi:replication factor A1